MKRVMKSQWPLDVLKKAQLETLVREEFCISGPNETSGHSQGEKMIEDMSYLCVGGSLLFGSFFHSLSSVRKISGRLPETAGTFWKHFKDIHGKIRMLSHSNMTAWGEYPISTSVRGKQEWMENSVEGTRE